MQTYKLAQPRPEPPSPEGVGASLNRQALALQAALFVVLSAVYWMCVRRYIVYDGEMLVRVTTSIVTQHSLRIEDPVFHLSQPYSYYGLAVSLLLVPLFVLGQLLFHDGLTLLTVFEPMVTAFTVVVLLRLLVELGISWRESLAISLLYAFGSLAWFYAGVLYSEQLVGLMLTIGVLCAVRYGRSLHRWWALACGAALSLALLARWDSMLLLIAPIAVYLLWHRIKEYDLRATLLDGVTFLAPILLVTAINVAYDILRYGRPLGGPYGKVVGFTTPLLTGLYGLLISPGAGLLVFVPLVILAPFGVRALYRRRPAVTVLIASLVLLRLFFYARWGDWDGGSSWGPRYLVVVLPMLFVLIAFVPTHRALTAATVLLATLSIGVELLGQIVPYGMYFTRALSELSNSDQVRNACAGCDLGHRVEMVNRILDFDPRYAPIVGQFKLLLRGNIDPLWAHVAPVVPVIVVVPAVIYVRLRRQAALLDRGSIGTTSRQGSAGMPPAATASR